MHLVGQWSAGVSGTCPIMSGLGNEERGGTPKEKAGASRQDGRMVMSKTLPASRASSQPTNGSPRSFRRGSKLEKTGIKPSYRRDVLRRGLTLLKEQTPSSFGPPPTFHHRSKIGGRGRCSLRHSSDLILMVYLSTQPPSPSAFHH
jgi:hypothetical protein